MSLPFVTPDPVPLEDDEFEFCLEEVERICYDVRRLLKEQSVRYMFVHNSLPGTRGLLLRDQLDLSLLWERLEKSQFTSYPDNGCSCRSIRSGRGIDLYLVVRIAPPSEEHHPVSGPILSFSAHHVQ
jgi:hypothetical protein